MERQNTMIRLAILVSMVLAAMAVSETYDDETYSGVNPDKFCRLKCFNQRVPSILDPTAFAACTSLCVPDCNNPSIPEVHNCPRDCAQSIISKESRTTGMCVIYKYISLINLPLLKFVSS